MTQRFLRSTQEPGYFGFIPAVSFLLGILPGLARFIREFEKVYSQINIIKEIDLEEKNIPLNRKIVIYRII